MTNGPLAYEVNRDHEDKIYDTSSHYNSQNAGPRGYFEKKTLEMEARNIIDASQERQLFLSLSESDSLKGLLAGLRPGDIRERDLNVLYRWTRPLIGSDDSEGLRARQMLGLDGIQIQGLLRNCQGYPVKHLISIVETYYRISR